MSLSYPFATQPDLFSIDYGLQDGGLHRHEMYWDGTDLLVSANPEFDQDEIDLIDAVVASIPTPSKVKVTRYLNKHDEYAVPMGVNFITGLSISLYPLKTIDEGELQDVEWHPNQNFDDIILKEVIVYNRDSNGFVIDSVKTITWYREDETAHPIGKSVTKIFSGLDQALEAHTRRRNIIDKLQTDTSVWLLATESYDPQVPAEVEAVLQLGRDFFRDYSVFSQGNDLFTLIDSYIQVNDSKLGTEILADNSHGFLDNDIGGGVTIRDKMIEAVDI